MRNVEEKIINMISGNIKNFVFIGEAGSGKSEIAINFSTLLSKISEKSVDFFDMDMTKPLFRSRDLEDELKAQNVNVHFQEQFMDAPTIVGGVRRKLRNNENLVVMDIGGDYIGARSIGAFEELLNLENTQVFYVINGFRPWSNSFDNVNQTFSNIMQVSHLNPERIKIIVNSNIGKETSVEDYHKGTKKVLEMISPYKEIEFSCVSENVYSELSQSEKSDVFMLKLHIDLDRIS